MKSLHFYQGRKKEKGKEIKKHPGGGPPARFWAKAMRQVSPGQESPVLEKQIITNLPGPKGAHRVFGQDPSSGRDALRLPGTLTEKQCHGEECTT